MFKRTVAAIASILLVSACGPDPTPLPVDMPLPTSTPASTAETRTYAVAVEARLLPLIPEADLRTAARSSEIVRVEAATELSLETNADVDLLVGLGDFPGSIRTALAIPLWLALNSEVAPLDQEVIAARLSEMLNTIDLSEALPGAAGAGLRAAVDPFQIRSDLANSGFPDGFALSMTVLNAPGAEAVAGSLWRYGIEVRLSPPTAGTAYRDSALLLFIDVHNHAQMTQRFGNAAIIELARLPVSYRAAPGLTIALTENGWPLLIDETLD